MERKKSVEKKAIDKKSLQASVTESTNSLGLSEKIRISILFVLHTVGLVGFSIDEYKPLFQLITPFHLIIITIVLLFEKSVLNINFLIFSLSAYLIGFFSEVFGVKSALLFGYYSYSDWLGYKFLDVPLVLGVLWVSTAYACNQLAYSMVHGTVLRIIVASLFMVMFDYTIEPFAVSANLWQWEMSVIPPYNYFSWFMVGIVLSIIYSYTVKNLSNKVSPYFIIVQVLFFLLYQLINNGISLSPF
mgnify:FL=1